MFEEIINLAPLGHAKSPQIKKLLLEKVNGDNAIYTIYTEWPNCPDLNNYMRISIDSETKDILAIDFDSGPYLSIGDRVKDKLITGFTYDGDFNNIKVILLDDGNTNTVSD